MKRTSEMEGPPASRLNVTDLVRGRRVDLSLLLRRSLKSRPWSTPDSSPQAAHVFGPHCHSVPLNERRRIHPQKPDVRACRDRERLLGFVPSDPVRTCRPFCRDLATTPHYTRIPWTASHGSTATVGSSRIGEKESRGVEDQM